MSRQYSTRTFIRHVPKDLLKRYFVRMKIKLSVTWSKLDASDVEPLFRAIQQLPDEWRALLESDFTMINELANPEGIRTILERATMHQVNCIKAFSEMENDYARAFWTFLHHSDHFEAAGAFHDMDRYGGWWRRFVGKRLLADTGRKAMKAFSERLRDYYWVRNCTRFCKVEHYQRLDPDRLCFCAYPEGMATSDVGYDDRGEFRRRPHRSAFEVIFIYRPEEGILELHAKGTAAEKEQLARVFCMTILDLMDLPDDSGRTPFDLSCLKNPHFPFTTDPRDGVEDVQLRQLRLDLPGDETKGIGRRILLSAADSPRARNAVHQLLADAINPKKIPLADVLLAQAKLTFVFGSSRNRGTKRLTFEIKYPDRCTLKDDHYDQIAKKYLKRWGIARD